MIITEDPKNNQSPALTLHDVVRSDVNLEKWSIWQPKNSRREIEDSISLTREILSADGKTLTVKVEAFSHKKFGNLTTEDQRVFYALLRCWNEKGQPSTPVSFSLRRLIKLLKRDYGIKQRHSVIRSLLRLRSAFFTWENSYYDSVKKELYEELNTFNILSDLKIVRTERDGSVNREAGLFKFDDLILGNIFNRHCKPVFLDTVLSFKSEIAQMLYTRLDLLLYDKLHYERRTKELFFDDLGLRGVDYNKVSARKRTLERALKELQGKPLTSGILSEAKLEKTQDEKDYKAVFTKTEETKRRVPKRQAQKALPLSEEQPAVEPTHDQLEREALELIRYFHRVFQQTDSTGYPSANSIKSAKMLVNDHGLEKAQNVVDFAYREAPKTNYKPRTVSGILQYAPEATKDVAQENTLPPQPTRNEDEIKRARDLHRTKHEQSWRDYITDRELEIKEMYRNNYEEFLEWLANERETFITNTKPEFKEMMAKNFDRCQRYQSVVKFFSNFDGYPILDFWQWDEKLNSNRFCV